MYLFAFAEAIQLFPDGTIFVHIAIVMAMIWILNRTLYRPINRVLASRDQLKGGQSTEAEKILAQVTEKETSYSKALLEARSAGYEIVEAEQKAVAEERESILKAAKDDSASRYENGRIELEKQALAARSMIDTEADKMADSIAENILKA